MINSKKINLLITCAGRRNYLINYFKEVMDNTVRVIAVDNDMSSAALSEADIVYHVPKVDSINYIIELKTIVKNENVDAIISLNDNELPILSQHKGEFKDLGAELLVSDTAVVEMCYDKWKTFLFLETLGLHTPKTYLFIDSVLKAVAKNEISYPLIIKPRWGSASIGIFEVENEKELKLAYEWLKIKLDKNTHKNADSEEDIKKIIIQEKIIGQEYGMDILNDFKGNYYASFVRKKIAMRGGETDKAFSVINDAFSELGKIVGSNTGHIGNMDCDFFVSNGKIYFLEMNPRFGGGYPFSHEAGVNIPAIYVSWLLGNSNVGKYNKYKDGIGFAKFDSSVKIGKYYHKYERLVKYK